MMKRALGDSAELADDQPVADERIVVQHASLSEFVGPVRIVIVGVVADLDVRRGDQSLEEANARMHRDGMLYVGVGSDHGLAPSNPIAVKSQISAIRPMAPTAC